MNPTPPSPSASPRDLFLEALEKPGPAERAAFLDGACRGDAPLRAAVDQLLQNHMDDSFLEQGAIDASTLVVPYVEQPGQCVGRYKLLQHIGEGGFGAVWMAEQLEPVSRRVALKIIKAGMDTREVIARFEAERQALAMMDHPNIAKVFDAGATDTGRPFFVMELVKGIPVTRFCDEQQLGTAERLALFGDVCSAINHAHQKGIIHRDIKPSNVMVTLHGDKAVVKVIDFGIAKATQGKLTDKTLFTRFEQFIGTPAYMSPEQAALSGLDIDTRSDIYALGVLLYELLTGKPPFDAKSLISAGYEEMRRIIREVEPPRPSSRLSTIAGEERTAVARARHTAPDKLTRLVEPDLDWIVMKAIEKDRTRRYETADSLALDIKRFLADEPVSARPPGTAYRVRKFVRRNRPAVFAAAAMFLLLAAGLTASLLLTRRAIIAESDASERAENERRLRNLAETRETQVRTILDFFQNRILAAGRPLGQEGGLGRDVPLREAIAEAEQYIGTGFADQPVIEASLRDVIGLTWHYLGETEKAVPHLERALTMRTAELGETNADTLAAMHHLVVALGPAGRRTERRGLCERLIRLQKETIGDTHPDTIRSMTSMTNILIESGKVAEALAQAGEIVAIARSVPGGGGQMLPVALNNQAVALSEAGRPDDAVPLLEEVVAWYRDHRRVDHPDTFISLFNLAGALAATGRTDLALPMMESVREKRESVLGDKHHDTIASMLDLAGRYSHEGNDKRAVELAEDAVERSELKFGPSNRETLRGRNILEGAWQAAGNWKQALPSAEETLRLMQKEFPALHPFLLAQKSSLATLYRDAGNLAAAKATALEAVQESKTALGGDHVQTIQSLATLAAVCAMDGEPDQAAKAAEEILHLARAGSPGTRRAAAESIERRASTFADVAGDSEAARLFEAALDLRQSFERAPSAERLTTMNNLAAVYGRTGRTKEALSLLERVVQLRKETCGGRDRRTLTAMYNFAATLRRAGRHDEAFSKTEEVVKLMQENLESGDPALMAAKNSLATLLCEGGKPAQGISLLEEVTHEEAAAAASGDTAALARRSNLFQFYLRDKQWEKARAFGKELQPELLNVRPPHHPEVTALLDGLLLACKELQDWAGAADFAASLVETVRKSAPDSAECAARLASWGVYLMKAGRYEAAEPALRDCLALREKHLPDDWRIFNARSLLGESLLGQKKLLLAGPFLTSGWEGMEARSAAIPAEGKYNLGDALDRLVRFSEAAGQPAEATKWRSKAAQLKATAP